MTGIEHIVATFADFWETAYATESANSGKLFAPACDYLVCVALMPYVPEDMVFGRTKDAVNSQGQLNDAEVAGKVPTIARDDTDDHLTYFTAQLLQFFVR